MCADRRARARQRCALLVWLCRLPCSTLVLERQAATTAKTIVAHVRQASAATMLLLLPLIWLFWAEAGALGGENRDGACFVAGAFGGENGDGVCFVAGASAGSSNR
ncbi:MAG: hypothetical protein IPK82_23155 [Polyangiaceae bacterium]|nr:hypothetical protein [Polyangiaceae bacterium]